jgi:predicted O-methyltransferase YrrM
MDTSNLRRAVPDYDTVSLKRSWMRAALPVFEQLGELSVFRAMSIGTRQILYQAIRAMGATSVLDIGTYTGTSALNFALATGREGSVVTVDIVDANAPDGFWAVDKRPRSPRQLMKAAGVAERVEFVTMDANAYLRETDRTFDFICIDAAKTEQDTYEQMGLALARLRPDGLIFMDDVFADGEPMPSGYFEPAHWNVLCRLVDEGVEIHPIPITETLHGARIACAWVIGE